METDQPRQAIEAKCLHPSGSFIEISKEEVEQSIPARFEKIAGKYPDRIAVKKANDVLTYAELNSMANRVARTILAQCGGQAEPIGIFFETGAALATAILGVLKSGNFFVLLDPLFPQARNVAELEDSQAKLVITNRQNVSSARKIQSNGCQLLEFESIDCGISAEDLRLRLAPKAFASIVYTSGSTGQPKGVVWDHRDLLHRIMLRTNETRARADDRITLLSSSTGNSITNTFLALLNGAALLPFDVQNEGATRLATWLLQERISICPISSPLFRSLCETLAGKENFPDLRNIRLRSETVYRTDVDLYKQFFSPKCSLENGLSTTETGQLTTYRINHNTVILGNEVPVGYAVEDKEIFLLDDTGNEVGFNEVGEIAVRSRYLSPGHWRRPDLDRAKFKPDPEGGEMRLCLTGDLGLMLPDGCLIHKGRKDFRVKVRGYGVEFAEVEKTLLEQEAIREVVVVARQNEAGESRLIAYFTSATQPVPSVTQLRGFLQEKLPDYMIPSAFVRVDAIPLTANGKVDRRALPDPGKSRPAVDTQFVAARSPVEEQIVRMWEEVLDVRPIGIRDDFFEMGGHSLLAVRLLAQVEKTFGMSLPPATFFQAPTVEQLAAILRQEGKDASWSPLVALQPKGSKPPFFWIHGENSNAFLPRYLGLDQPLYGLLHQSHGGKRARYTRIEDIAAHYAEEMRTVQPDGPYFLGGFCIGGIIAFEMAQQLRRQGKEIALLLLLDPSWLHNGKVSSPYSLLFSSLFPIMTLDEIFRHLRRLALLGSREKLAYLLDGARWWIKERVAKIREFAARVACKAYLVTHPADTIPPSLRIPYIDIVHHRASRSYVPRVYSGRVVVFKTQGRYPDPQLAWGELAGGGLEVVEVPGHHTEIVFGEEQIRGLARELKACLDSVQTYG